MGWKTLTIIGIWLLLIARPVVAQDLGAPFLKNQRWHLCLRER